MGARDEECLQVVYECSIKAGVDKVFPLCCPVQEYKWIDGWKCQLVFCPNDRVEEGTVFREILSAPFLLGTSSGKTTWRAVLYEPEHHRLHFSLVNDVSSSLYKIELSSDDVGATRVRLDLSYRPTSAKGRRVVASRGPEKIRTMLMIIAEMLRHYCETGRRLDALSVTKLALRADCLTLTDDLRLGLNKLAMIHMKDPDRRRFLTRFSA